MEGDVRTCHPNGRDLRFRRANAMANNRQTPPGCVKPSMLLKERLLYAM